MGGGIGPKRKWAPAPENFFGRAPPLFGSKSTISRFGERFRDGQYSLVSFFLICCPSTYGVPVPSHLYKWGARASLCPMESAPLSGSAIDVDCSSINIHTNRGAKIARPDKTAPDQTARLNNGGYEKSSP